MLDSDRHGNLVCSDFLHLEGNKPDFALKALEKAISLS
jgi:hypothetical protein